MADAILADIETERQFVGLVLEQGTYDPGKMRMRLQQLRVPPDRLYDPTLREVLQIASDLLSEGKPCDAISVSHRLKSSKLVQAAGGAAFVSELSTPTGVADSMPSYAETIRGLALRRKLVAIASDLSAKAKALAMDPASTLSESTKALAAITVGGNSIRTLGDVMIDVIGDMEAVAAGENKRLIPTGLTELDNQIGGLQPTLIIVGAEPGVGKSAFLASVVRAVAKSGRKVGVFSLEDEARWLGWRILAYESRVPQPVLKGTPLSEGQSHRVAKAISRIGPYANSVLVDDRSALTPTEIVQTSIDMIVNHGAGAIVVDHLGEVRFDGKAERYDLAVGEGLRELRDIAKRHGVPVVVASQLARRKDRKPGDIPTKSDFKNSGDIEAAARVLLGLAREPKSDILKIGVIKQTNGDAGVEVPVKFVGLAGMVEDCEGAKAKNVYAEQDAIEMEAQRENGN